MVVGELAENVLSKRTHQIYIKSTKTINKSKVVRENKLVKSLLIYINTNTMVHQVAMYSDM